MRPGFKKKGLMLTPPFSPRWCFTCDGHINIKGATKTFQDKMDDELYLRLKHRENQGLLCRMLPFNGLKAEQIGNESLLRTIVKLTAPCWTRCMYRYPPLANLIWKHWQDKIPIDIKANTPANIPRGWQKIHTIADEIIKQCPFCVEPNNTTIEPNNTTSKRIGNLEHLHLYCTYPTKINVRTHCHNKIELATHDLYNFASRREYNLPFQECS